MTLISLDNLKKSLNIGWILLIAYFLVMIGVFLFTNPPAIMGAEIYAAALVFLVIGLSLKD